MLGVCPGGGGRFKFRFDWYISCQVSYMIIIEKYYYLCRFCSACAEKVRKRARFCWNYNNDQSKNGPPDWSEKSSSACSSSQVTSFGRPQTHKRKAMSFESYVTAKSSEKSEK